MLEAATALVDSSNYLLNVPHNIKEGMMENLTEVKEELHETYEEMHGKYGELHDRYTEFVKSVKEGAENLIKRGIGTDDEPEDEDQ